MRSWIVGAVVVSWVAVAGASAPLAGLPAPRSADRLSSVPDVGMKHAQSLRERKLSGRLRAAFAAGPKATGGLVAAEPLRAPDGRLQVYLHCDKTGPSEMAALERAGATIDAADAASGLVQVRLDATALDTVAAFSWVRTIRSIDRPVVRAGSVTTEGDAGSHADAVRAQGLDGSGIVVGVISDGIDSLAQAQASGDLGDVRVPADPRCRRGAGDEGTALLEIVHDVAPGAQLLFAGPGSSLEMIEAVQCLTDAGANVIVDDLGFFGEPYFQDGPVAAAVRSAVQAGVSYHSSAGNEAEDHLEQDFTALPGAPTVHDFGGGDNLNAVVIPPGGSLTCVLEWNDPFGASANDYDLLVFDADLHIITFSVDTQNGQGDPIEAVQVDNPTDDVRIANILINRFEGEARRLELFCLGGGPLEHSTPAGSIVGHPALREVVAVGAIDASDPGRDDVEVFSSQGPSRVDFPAVDTREKPDLAAFDGVTISNAGGFPACPPFCAFFGTSAAAPHSAGVAALLLQQNPALSPATVQDLLVAGATDIGAPGRDDLSGAGRLDALRSFELADQADQPECTDDGDCGGGDVCSTTSCRDGRCVADAVVCDDGDACTVDACDPDQGCTATPREGTDGLACRIGQLLAPDLCAPGDLDQRAQKLLASRANRALELVQKAAQAEREKQRTKLLDKAVRQLTQLVARLEHAVERERVASECVDTITQIVETGLVLVGVES